MQDLLIPEENTTPESAHALTIQHLEGVVASEVFSRSASLRELLVYLHGNQHRDLNEYSIAVEALHRKADFEPKIDATVRVQIARLRRKLNEYYLGEGRETSLRFHVPLGGHHLVVEGRSPFQETQSAVLPKAPPRTLVEQHVASASPNRKAFPWIQVLATVFVLAGAAFMAGRLTSKKSSAAAATLPLFWHEVLDNNKTNRIIIPNPVFFLWNTPRDVAIVARDTSINDYSELASSPEIQGLSHQLGTPSLAQSYVVANDAESSSRLTRFLLSRQMTVEEGTTSESASDVLENSNLVLIGNYGTLAPFHSHFDPLYFRFGPYERSVLDTLPQKGTPPHFDLLKESPTRQRVPGIIAFVPGSAKGTHTLILAGARTAALVAFLTSESGLAELESARNRNGAAGYFEAVIMSEIDGNNYLQSHVAALRPYQH